MGRDGERGIGKFTFLIFALLVGGALFVAYNVVPFYYYYYDLQNQFEQMTKVASTESDQDMREKLMYYINRYEIPVKGPEALKIERVGRHIKISLKYQEVFYVTWEGKDYDLRVFDFHVFAERDY